MLRIHVDSGRCQHYGQCVLEAPQVFSLTDLNELEWQAMADDSLRPNIEAAADVCPMQAITLLD